MSKEAAIRTGESSPPLLFRQVSPGPGDSTMQFRLLHFWDARKNVKGGPGILLGIELLLIDAEGTVAQGFIGQNRRNQYEKELKRGMIYTLTNYYASNNKVMYHVADQRLVICISHASELRKVEEDIEAILTERFRIHSFADFEANCDLRGDLHDVVGHLKLVDGHPLHERPILCIKDDSASRKVLVHLQLKDGPVINVYLWDEAAVNFRVKFDACADTPTVVLVTTVNPKRLGGNISHSILDFLITQIQLDNPIRKWGDAAELDVPRHECFTDTIGQTKKFRIKVGHYNFTSTRMSLTATKIVSAAELPPKNLPLKTPAVTEVENTELAESSGGGASAIEEEKKPKRAKCSG
ncbi:hypothetical protein Bca4012_078676 [Brassica carinata]